ncbi:Acg family FMN-binding oxidoreductase [Nocardia sp. NPDC127579]|uniref:Acg family FMN-binding oxidoreductase n=1 Tax=Nocardia sp. NPDC127579 TaxID=3345402 RepID=UPI003637AD11
MSTIPEAATCRDALEFAIRAPSVHNTQPWRWQLRERSLEFFADFARQIAATDPCGRALMVSCGAALHHLRVAFATLGWHTEIVRLPDPDRPDHLASMTFRRQPPTDHVIELAAAALSRRSDRRRYPDTASAGDLRTISALATEYGAVARHVPHTMLPTLTEPMRSAARRHAADPEYLRELEEWSGCHGREEGVPARNIPPSRLPGEIPLRNFAAAELSEYTDEEDRAHWAVVCTAHDGFLAQLKAGEATSAMLLEATRRGLATSLQSEPLGIPELRSRIRTSVLHDCAYPHVMMRLGRMPRTAAPLERTPRRALSEVFETDPFGASEA